MNTKILTLVGGISKDSLNKKLFQALKDLAPKDFTLDTFDISSLPFFNQDLEEDLPQSVRDLKNKIEDAHAVLFITPEYNRSVPGVLKNAIDWGSRPYGQNSWDQKPCGVLGASPGNIGSFGAQNHLRQTLTYLNMDPMPTPEMYIKAFQAFDENGKLKSDGLKDLIQKYLLAFNKWIGKNTN